MSAHAAPVPPSARGDDARVIAVVSVAHGCSHFFQLIVVPLFPWLKAEFGLSYAQLGLLMSVMYVVSGLGQTLAGFVVDRFGAVPVMLASLAGFVLAALTIATAADYPMLMVGLALVGLANAPFHPVDYSILNARIATPRLAHAYSVHGIVGSLGWAIAPPFLVGITELAGWRVAAGAAGLVAGAIGVAVWLERARLAGTPVGLLGIVRAASSGPASAGGGSAFAFLRLPAVWMTFLFFLVSSIAFGAIQTFGPESSRLLHGMDSTLVALCLTAYMLASAAGMVVGGFVAADPARAERTIGVAYALSATVALVLGLVAVPGWAVPAMFAAMGAAAGVANPSRDLLVRRASPPGATGRVYGTVYSGLDAGMAIAPLVFAWMMDGGLASGVWIGVAAFQALLILTAVNVGRVARAGPGVPAAAR